MPQCRKSDSPAKTRPCRRRRFPIPQRFRGLTLNFRQMGTRWRKRRPGRSAAPPARTRPNIQPVPQITPPFRARPNIQLVPQAAPPPHVQPEIPLLLQITGTCSAYSPPPLPLLYHQRFNPSDKPPPPAPTPPKIHPVRRPPDSCMAKDPAPSTTIPFCIPFSLWRARAPGTSTFPLSRI